MLKLPNEGKEILVGGGLPDFSGESCMQSMAVWSENVSVGLTSIRHSWASPVAQW